MTFCAQLPQCIFYALINGQAPEFILALCTKLKLLKCPKLLAKIFQSSVEKSLFYKGNNRLPSAEQTETLDKGKNICGIIFCKNRLKHNSVSRALAQLGSWHDSARWSHQFHEPSLQLKHKKYVLNLNKIIIPNTVLLYTVNQDMQRPRNQSSRPKRFLND